MLSILNKPFPLSTWRKYWLRSVGFGLFIFLFLYFFQPFRLDLYADRMLFISSVYGLVTAFVLLLGGFVLVKIVAPRINEEKWTLGKQILWMIGLMVCIALLNTYATQLMHGVKLPVSIYFIMLKWVVMLGIFPIVIAELIAYNYYLQQNLSSANQLSGIIDAKEQDSNNIMGISQIGAMYPAENTYKPLVPHQNNDFSPLPAFIQLTGENQNENLQLKLENLLAVQSVDNYVTVLWEENGVLQSQMLRNTLTNIATQLTNCPCFFRTHRAWLVNIKRVKHVDGNAQGLKLTVELLSHQVPVSRNNINAFKETTERFQRLDLVNKKTMV